MEKEVLELIKNKKEGLSLKKIKKGLGLSCNKEDNNLLNALKNLELEGNIYCNENNLYTTFPSNFFIGKVCVSNKGNPYTTINGKNVDLKPEKLSGVLNYDTVILRKNKKDYELVKVLKRNINPIVCEVKINNDNHKYIEVCNQKIKTSLRISTQDIKKLSEGERVLVAASVEKYDDIYEGKFIKRIGHKNDLDTELKTIISNNGFLTEYNDDILKEIELIPDEVLESDLVGRVDKRQDKIFTIDGAYTKDIDDAVEIKKLDNGNFLLTVSIAHVSHYVKPGSALWQFASENTTSLYLVNSVLAMLHTKLSNNICSLNPDVDRLARSFEMEIDKFGNTVNFKTYKSVIHSRKKMVYDDVNKILEDNQMVEGYEDYIDDLKLLEELSNILTNKKQKDGAIDFNNKELSFRTDENGNIISSIIKSGIAEKIIENCMVATNVSVGEYYSNLLLPFIFRNHDFPILEKIEDTYKQFKELGYRFNKLFSVNDPLIVQKLINGLKDKEEFSVLSIIILRSLQRAYYSKDNHGHYGLAVDYYSQSTSPIRRFLDLVIHHLIDYYESCDNLINTKALEKSLNKYCEDATLKERCADKAEYEADKLYMAKYMENRIGEDFYGYALDINSNALYVKTTDLFEGAVYYTTESSERYNFCPERKSLFDKRKKQYINIGSKMHLRLKSVDLASRLIIFDILNYNLDEIKTLKKTQL